MAKRPRERSGGTLDVLAVTDTTAPVEAIGESLSSFVAPVDPDVFRRQYFRKKSLAIKVHPKLRDARLVGLREMMADLHPMSMLEASNSEAIYVWMKTASGELRSIRTDPAQAKTCYDAGHALYFRGSEELESTLLPPIARDLGFTFAAKHRDGARRSEIETFVAKPGHVTTWHFDFQENLTVQLKGAKKWNLYRPSIESPSRAYASHFTAPEHQRTRHTQYQVLRASTASEKDAQFSGVPEDIDEKCESVVLQEGDVLYHQAGVWHSVETLDAGPSVSINLSFAPATWAEVVGEALTHRLLLDPALRERVAVGSSTADAHKQLTAALARSVELLEGLKPNDVLPVAVVDDEVRLRTVVWGPDGVQATGERRAIGKLPPLQRNPLGVVSPTPDDLAFPVALDSTTADDDDEDSEEEEDAEKIISLEGFERFDLSSNFLADEQGAWGAPAVAVTFFVEKGARARLFRKTVCSWGADGPVPAKDVQQLPADLTSVFLEVGFLGPA